MNRRLGLMIPLVPLLIAADRAPAERVVTGKGLVEVTVNGEKAVLRVDPAAPAMPLLDAGFAERSRFKTTGHWGVGIGYKVGGTSVMSRTQVVPVDLGAGRIKRRVGWTARPFAPAGDGSVGPEAFPEAIVRFQFRAPIAGETTTVLPMERATGPLGLFGNFSATFATIEVGGEPMHVRFDPYHARTLVTAGAGARLAAFHDGSVSGAAVSTEIFFGIERPVRTLSLARPLRIGTLSLSTLGLRTADFGNASGIREAGAAADPDEIVVAAKGRKRDRRRDTLSLGADYLSRCSSIVFDRGRDVIRLTCA